MLGLFYLETPRVDPQVGFGLADITKTSDIPVWFPSANRIWGVKEIRKK